MLPSVASLQTIAKTFQATLSVLFFYISCKHMQATSQRRNWNQGMMTFEILFSLGWLKLPNNRSEAEKKVLIMVRYDFVGEASVRVVRSLVFVLPNAFSRRKLPKKYLNIAPKTQHKPCSICSHMWQELSWILTLYDFKFPNRQFQRQIQTISKDLLLFLEYFSDIQHFHFCFWMTIDHGNVTEHWQKHAFSHTNTEWLLYHSCATKMGICCSSSQPWQ